MGTLYIVGVPFTGADDLTFRARRILGTVALVVAADPPAARDLLLRCDISTPVAGAKALLEALEAGDAAFLLSGWAPLPGPAEMALLRRALERGFCLVPIPGPALPLAALVLSGLPADRFVYLGELTAEDGRDLLAPLAGEERTLLFLTAGQDLAAVLRLLAEILGRRPLVLLPGRGDWHQVAWRGTTSEALEQAPAWPATGRYVLVAGGAPGEAEPWDEERLQDEIRARLQQGLLVSEISRDLASASGWPRREVYRLAVQIAQFPGPGQMW